MKNYNAEELLDLIFKYIVKVIISNDYYSIKYSKGTYASLSYFGYEIFCIELNKSENVLIVYDSGDLTDNTLLNIYDISNYFINRIGPGIGKGF